MNPFESAVPFSAFKSLHQRRQLEHLARHGHPLAERHEDSFCLSLYAVGTYYAEVWRGRGNEQVLFVHAFDHPRGLTDYLELISVNLE